MKVVVAGRFYELQDLGDEKINSVFVALFEGFFIGEYLIGKSLQKTPGIFWT